MARREVIEVKCDRCGRPDLQEKGMLIEEPELIVTFRKQKFEYKDLCTRCRDAVGGYFKRMTKQEEVTDPKAGAVDPPAPVDEPVVKPVEEPKKRGFLGGR
jgi:hypothetical protein